MFHATRSRFCLFLLLGVIAGCRDSGGDVSADARSDAPSGDDQTIYDVQNGTIQPGSPVTLRGVVVTALDRFGERTGELYVSELAGGPYSGVLVFGAERSVVDTLAVGDLVDIEGGILDEFDCAPCGTPFSDAQTLTEITPAMGGAITVTKVGTAAVPAPTLVEPWVLAGDPAEAEKWEGVLITFENVAVLRAPRAEMVPDRAEFDVTGPYAVSAGLTELSPDAFSRGDCFASVSGIGGYFYEPKLLPRGAGDFVAGGTCVTEDSAETCANGVDDDRNGFVDCADFSCQTTLPECVVATTITDVQTGMVAARTRVLLDDVVVTAVAADQLWVQDAAGGLHSGVIVFPLTPPEDSLVPGSVVDVEGQVTEYFCTTEIEDAVVTAVSVGLVPLPLDVADVAALHDPAPMAGVCDAAGTAEPYEGVLVRIRDVSVVAAPDMYGEWTVGAAIAPVHVDDVMHDAAPAPAPGDCFFEIIGVLHYSYGVFKIEPRSADDLVRGDGCP